MHVEERAEAAFLAAVEKPVDRTLARALHAVSLAVIREEPVAEVRADNLARRAGTAERVGDELQVLFHVLLAKCSRHEVDEQPRRVVVEVLDVGEGDDAVRIGREAGLGHLLQILGKTFALVRQHETWLVKRIAPHDAAHRIADETLHLVRLRANVIAALQLFWHIIVTVEDDVHTHLVERHLNRNLILHMVDFGKDAVELFLVGLKLIKALVAFSFPGVIHLCEGRTRVTMTDERKVHEIPRDFVGIPIILG